MPETEKDLNTDQLVADTDLKADVVDQQDLNNADLVNQAQQDGTLADGTTKDKTVKYEELEKAIKAKNDAQEQTAYAQRQLELMEQNAQQVQRTAPKTTMEQALDQCGLEAADLYGENIVRVQAVKDQLDAQQRQQGQAVMASQQFIATHPDLTQVVGSVNPTTGQLSAPSTEVMALAAKRPSLAYASTQEIYEAVLQEREIAEFKKNQTVTTEAQKRQGVENKTKPLGGAAAGGGGGAVQGPGLLSREQMAEYDRKLDNDEVIT